MTEVELREEIASDEALSEEDEEQKRRKLVLLLLLLLLLLLCVAGGFCRYLLRPAPLPYLVPVPVDLDYPPHYLFSIYGVNTPVGVSVSPAGDRIFVAESGGEREIKVFKRNGEFINAFNPPETRSAQRSPVYLAFKDDNLFVTDRLQHAVFVYDAEGTYLDTLLSPELSLSEFVSKHIDGRLKKGTTFAFNLFNKQVTYQLPGKESESLPGLDTAQWSPLGVRFSPTGEMLLTEVSESNDQVLIFPDEVDKLRDWPKFDFPVTAFGSTGQGDGQFLFPNSAVADSQGRIYVSDGNNGRVSTWTEQGEFLFNFGQGSGDASVSLPRGAFIDARERLYIVDAVGQNVKVFDVSGEEPEFLFTFGDWGTGDGLFNYPNDIALDQTGRLYIADRENNRIQVWSY